jgi:hypothetical protein
MNEIRLAPNTSVCVLGSAASAKSPELTKAIVKSTMSRNKRKFEFLVGGVAETICTGNAQLGCPLNFYRSDLTKITLIVVSLLAYINTDGCRTIPPRATPEQRAADLRQPHRRETISRPQAKVQQPTSCLLQEVS